MNALYERIEELERREQALLKLGVSEQSQL